MHTHSTSAHSQPPDHSTGPGTSAGSATTGDDTSSSRDSDAETLAADEKIIPIVEERVVVGTEKVERRRVLVRTRVETREEVVEQPMLTEELEVRRVPVNRRIEAAPAVRMEGDTTIVPVVEEVIFVEKRLMLREEVHIRKRRVETTERQTVSLRREVAEIEEVEPTKPPVH